jgi:hypothetical protein
MKKGVKKAVNAISVRGKRKFGEKSKKRTRLIKNNALNVKGELKSWMTRMGFVRNV